MIESFNCPVQALVVMAEPAETDSTSSNSFVSGISSRIQ